jgi:methionyl-tRNA formyltransferase
MADKLKKEETLIDWNKSAKDIHNLVRGVYHSPSAYFIHNDKIIKVLKTVVEDNSNDHKAGDMVKTDKNGVVMQTGDGLIRLITVKPEGKGEMSARDWANGLKE